VSHEGIRIVSAEEAARADREERHFSREEVTPAKVRVLLTEGKGLEIDWKDGHRSAWSFYWLRHGCPCATCHEERMAAGRKPGVPKVKPATMLPMYQEPPKPLEVTPAGKYALKFKWNDGHESGNYSWEYLRRVCQCEECLKSRE
jgi:DUF971 family protein